MKTLPAHYSETIIDETTQDLTTKNLVMAEINGINDFHLSFKLSDVPSAEKLEKFVEDVK